MGTASSSVEAFAPRCCCADEGEVVTLSTATQDVLISVALMDAGVHSMLCALVS